MTEWLLVLVGVLLILGTSVFVAAECGVTAIIHPGGASEDKDAAEACDRRGVALASTGVRHFRH